MSDQPHNPRVSPRQLREAITCRIAAQLEAGDACPLLLQEAIRWYGYLERCQGVTRPGNQLAALDLDDVSINELRRRDWLIVIRPADTDYRVTVVDGQDRILAAVNSELATADDARIAIAKARNTCTA